MQVDLHTSQILQFLLLQKNWHFSSAHRSWRDAECNTNMRLKPEQTVGIGCHKHLQIGCWALEKFRVPTVPCSPEQPGVRVTAGRLAWGSRGLPRKPNSWGLRGQNASLPMTLLCSTAEKQCMGVSGEEVEHFPRGFPAPAAPGTAGICSTRDSGTSSTTDSGISRTTDSGTSSTRDSAALSTTDSPARPGRSHSFTPWWACVPLYVTARTAQSAPKGKGTALRAIPVPGEFPTNSKVYFSHRNSLRGIHEKVSGQKLYWTLPPSGDLSPRTKEGEKYFLLPECHGLSTATELHAAPDSLPPDGIAGEPEQ